MDSLKNSIEIDLFEYYNEQPEKLSKITNKWLIKYENGEVDYIGTENFLKEVQEIGYTFNYGLDNEPYFLRHI